MPHCFIGLGSNLDNPRQQVCTALDELAQLPSTELLAASPLYYSKAVGPGEQDDYINGAAMLNTELTALELLDQLQAIEQRHKRLRLEHWGPRTLDLDLLSYGDDIIDHPRLQVPHPFLAERNFVIYPLYDLAPDLKLADGRELAEIYKLSNQNDLTRLSP